MHNLLANLPQFLPEELTEALVSHPHVRIERIVSTGQASPAGSWYDQDDHEWIVVLAGEAQLEFAEPSEFVQLSPGDHMNIDAHRKHRVAWTSPRVATVWLAVFYR